MTQPTHLLFDIMGTAVHDPFLEAGPHVLGISSKEFERLLDLEAMLQFEVGAIDEATYLDRCLMDRRPVDGSALRDYLRRSYRWLPGMEEVLADLHQRGISMHAFSDYSIWFELVEEAVGLSRYLPWSFVSCKTGVCKPEPRAFTGAAATLGIVVQNCLLIDDKKHNCEAARSVGMLAIEFRGAEALRADLISFGLI